ncbi:MAG: hypothetical protein H7Y11_02240 [Armatimonadetes bacterium]|nr:hypothetical protein [Anaerolineae bacterium]
MLHARCTTRLYQLNVFEAVNVKVTGYVPRPAEDYDLRIVRHLLPNLVGALITLATFEMSAVSIPMPKGRGF